MRSIATVWITSLVLLGTSCGDGSKVAVMVLPDVSASDGSLDWDEEFRGLDDVSEDLLDDLTQGDDGVDAADLPGDVPMEPEMDPVLAQSFQNILDEYLALTGNAGAAMAVRTEDGAWWEGASGLSDILSGLAMGPDNGFRVGSNTKPFVATVTLMLWEEGLLDIDDSVTTYLPQYPQWEEVTVRQLLGMSAGIPDYLSNSEFIFTAMMDPEQLDDPAVLVSYVDDLPFLFAPGEGCVYSNTNYVLAGMIIEAVTGHSIESELNGRILDPLGLDHTFLDVEGSEIEGLSHGYMDLALVAYMFGVPLEALSFIPAEWFIEGMVVDATYIFPPSVSWSAGALVSTPRDMATFMRALLRGELLGPKALAEMKTTVDCKLVTGDLGYGLGMQVHETSVGMLYGHGGLNFGYQAMTMYYEALDLTFSHMHNYLPEQGDLIHMTILPWVSEGLEEVYAPCLPPDGFFAEGGTRMHVRFGGPLNMEGLPYQIPGVGSVKQSFDDDVIPLYGFGTAAKIQFQDGNQRVVIESVAPVADASGAALRLASVNMAPGVLASGDGLVDLGGFPAWTLFASVADIFVSPGETEPDRLCYTAVTRFDDPGTVYICTDEGFKVELGSRFKIYGDFRLETNPVTLDALFYSLGGARCLCKGNNDEWNACPAE